LYIKIAEKDFFLLFVVKHLYKADSFFCSLKEVYDYLCYQELPPEIIADVFVELSREMRGDVPGRGSKFRGSAVSGWWKASIDGLVFSIMCNKYM
jgi:hypothetical protein